MKNKWLNLQDNLHHNIRGKIKNYGHRPSEAWLLSYGLLKITEKVLNLSTLSLNEGCCMSEK
jgi:hypothetical protein